MFKTRIKVCGITSVEDAKICFSLGVDYLGVIFADSSRKVSADTVRRIISALPGAKLVGVFADSPLEYIKQTAEFCGLNMIQLHGRETPEYCNRLLALTSIPIIKAIPSSSTLWMNGLSKYEKTSYFLFDLDKKTLPHSTPLQACNSALEKLWIKASRARNKGYRIFLGGALSAENVRSGIKMVAPFCVDVCRGVEKRPGVKDEVLLQRFISEVRA